PVLSLIKGGLSEAQAGCTIWKDVSKETFELFVKFAYTGNYSIPETKKRDLVVKPERVKRNTFTDQASPSSSSGIQAWHKAEEVNKAPAVEEPKEYIEKPVAYEEEVAAEASSDYNHGRFRKDKKSSPPPVVRTTREKYPEPPSPRLSATDFPSLFYPLLTPRNNHDSTCEPIEQFEPDQSYSNVLLAHASLYILGDYRLIDSLKALALYKLHKTLCIFQLNDENVKDVIDFARYTYSEGQCLEEGRLRGLVCRYMATNAVVLSHAEEFIDLLGEEGEFVKDFFKFELQMIH
ncbi:uncharacterized protein LY89DRAFT_589405, partial [Mollisia scopiformis]